MPTATHTPLANITLGSSASSVTFSSIPATYRDLILVIDGTVSAGGGEVVNIQFNSDSTAGNYPAVFAQGNGSTTSSSTLNQYWGLIYSTRSNTITSVMDYSATDKHKTWLSRANGSANVVSMVAGRWANTAAITSLRVNTAANAFASGSTFALYGVIA